MRIAVGGFALESVSFLPHPTDIEDFERSLIHSVIPVGHPPEPRI